MSHIFAYQCGQTETWPMVFGISGSGRLRVQAVSEPIGYSNRKPNECARTQRAGCRLQSRWLANDVDAVDRHAATISAETATGAYAERRLNVTAEMVRCDALAREVAGLKCAPKIGSNFAAIRSRYQWALLRRSAAVLQEQRRRRRTSFLSCYTSRKEK